MCYPPRERHPPPSTLYPIIIPGEGLPRQFTLIMATTLDPTVVDPYRPLPLPRPSPRVRPSLGMTLPLDRDRQGFSGLFPVYNPGGTGIARSTSHTSGPDPSAGGRVLPDVTPFHAQWTGVSGRTGER